jgi:lipoate-protein ligase A
VRLIRSGALPPALNLALDEALLRSGTQTLRLYDWDPPGLSIGFFQRAEEFDSVEGYEMVRRPTGGGAIAHTGELTIAWIGERQRVDAVYERTNRLVAEAVRPFGIVAEFGEGEPEAAPRGLCFDAHTRYDLMAGGRKFFGSAQRRGAGRFLMHGTLVLSRNPLSRGAVSLSELAGREVTRHEIEQAVIATAERLWEGKLTVDSPNSEEWAHADRLVLERYGTDAWNRRR